MFFHALTSAWPQGDGELEAWKATVLSTPMGQADVVVSESHVWSLLFHKVFLSLENFGKTLALKCYFCITMRTLKIMNDSLVLKTHVPEQRLTSLNYVHSYIRYCWWRHFLWQPRMRICKEQKTDINSTRFAWLIHRVFPAKSMTVNSVQHRFLCNNVYYQMMLRLGMI